MKAKRNKIFLITSLVCSIIGFSSCFVAGKFSSNVKKEENAEYATEIALTKTTSSKYFSLTVEPIGNDTLPNPYVEFNNLYGTFRQSKITFASAINIYDETINDKTHSIHILGSGNEKLSQNLSLFYVGPIGVIPYEDHYMHYVYPIEVMFTEDKFYDISQYVAYISQSHADRILQQRGVVRANSDGYSFDQYKTLQKTLIPVEIDGVISDFVVQNIYFEKNYYYEGLNNVLNDFVMISYYLPSKNKLREEQKNLYFMSEYPYQNQYFMDHICNTYSKENYLLRVNHQNLMQDVDDEKLLNFYYGDNKISNNWVSIILASLSVLIVCTSLFFFFKKKKHLFLHEIIASIAASLIPYIVFFCIYKYMFNVVYFTKFSCVLFFSLFVFYIFALLLTSFFINRNSRIKGGQNELNL